MIKKNYWLLVSSLVIGLSAGFLGSLFTNTGPETWHSYLTKPSFNPPDWLFGPVWTSLFILMGLSLFLVWRQGLDKIEVRKALQWFFLQLAFNIAWSFFFFYLENPHLAFLGIIALLILIITTMAHFYKIDKRSFWLLVPYLAWVSFATVLNYAIWKLN